jgi:hypothetical protein
MSKRGKEDSIADLSTSGFLGVGEEILATGKGYVIEFFHVPTRRIVKFKSMLTDYTDSFTTNFNSEEVYGRMDPMVTYTNTTRSISLGWNVIACSEDEATQNLQKCSLLFSMLYPSYDVSTQGRLGGATTIAAAPLFKLKFVNLISSGKGGVQTSGLLGSVGGFDFSPNLELGFFDKPGVLLPKQIDLSCDFQVIHQHPLGWTNEGAQSSWRGGSDEWLYGTRMHDDAVGRFASELAQKGGGTVEQVEANAKQVLESLGEDSMVGAQWSDFMFGDEE